MKLYPHEAGQAFPFKHMQIGDVCISTAVNAVTNAHAFGQRTGRKFRTRRVTNRTTGAPGWRIERVSEVGPYLDPSAPLKRPQQPRAPRHWPFMNLDAGGVWKCTEVRDMFGLRSAVLRENRRAAAAGRPHRYSVRARAELGEMWVARTQ